MKNHAYVFPTFTAASWEISLSLRRSANRSKWRSQLSRQLQTTPTFAGGNMTRWGWSMIWEGCVAPKNAGCRFGVGDVGDDSLHRIRGAFPTSMSEYPSGFFVSGLAMKISTREDTLVFGLFFQLSSCERGFVHTNLLGISWATIAGSDRCQTRTILPPLGHDHSPRFRFDAMTWIEMSRKISAWEIKRFALLAILHRF